MTHIIRLTLIFVLLAAPGAATAQSVPPERAADAALGYKGLTLDTLIRMRDHGVDPEYVRRVQQRGTGRLSVDELIQRRDRGDGER